MFAEMPRVIAEGHFCILDLETTGLSRYKDDAVQIAFALVDKGKFGLRGYYTLCPHAEISPGAAAKHGYTYDKLMHSPMFHDVAVELLEIIGNRTIVGHNVKQFDVPMLARQFNEVSELIQFNPPIIDLLPWSRKLMPGIKHGLQDLVAALDVQLEQRHDAWQDCRMTFGVLYRLATRFPDFGNLEPAAACAEKKK